MGIEDAPTVEINDANVPTLDAAREAYARGNREVFDVWYVGRQRRADQDPTSYGRFEISVDLARIQHGAGERDEAVETVSGVNEAIQQELIEMDRSDVVTPEGVDKAEYIAKLKVLLQNVSMLRQEFRS